jgi:signal transduction histidine kinase
MGTEETSQPNRESILIADDTPDSLRLLSGILRAEGYRVRPVPNGRLALRAAASEPPDLIMLDVDMPEMNGFQVCRALKTDERMRDIPVIFVSALDDERAKVEGLEIGAVDYVTKPFQPGEITARVRTHLSLGRLQRELAQSNAQLRVQAQTLAHANAELARAAQAKDEFLASMSHELRTPLNAILGLAEVLHEGIYGPIGERQREAIRSIEESGSHLLDLINDVLDVAKIEAGQLALQLSSVSVASVCQASLELVAPQAREKEVALSSRLDGAVTTVQADERRLKQMLVNLLSNAVKFTDRGGQVGLEVTGDEEKETVHFGVWDTGIGIAEDDISRLFQPFVQLDSSLSRQHTGTGLGLALVQRLADMHGGSVSVESAGVPGEGSRFTVTLPWREAEGNGEEDGGEAGEGAAPAPASLTILLADDNETSVEMTADYMVAHGYRVIVARDGTEAIHRVLEERPDLILMDIQMPGMDGLEAIRRLRQHADPAGDGESNLADTPIIALTALAMPGDRERCLAAGADTYLSKPIRLKRLMEVIDEQVQARGHHRPQREGAHRRHPDAAVRGREM